MPRGEATPPQPPALNRRSVLARAATVGVAAASASVAAAAIAPDDAAAADYAILGDDGTVGGPDGSPLSSSIVTTTSSLIVSAEKVWLTDPSLSAQGDPTGAADSSLAFEAAIAKAASVLPGYGAPVVSGPPGIYKCLASLYFPSGVALAADGRAGSLIVHFPDLADPPTLAFCADNVAANATTVAYNNGGMGPTAGTFASASADHPQTALVNDTVITYTGDTGSVLTGVAGLVGGAGQGAPIVQGYAVQFASHADGVPTVADEGIEILGPGSGSFASWATDTPPSAADGVYLGGQVRVNCLVAGFRFATTFTQDHQQWGSSYKANGCYASIFFGPTVGGPGADQSIEQGAHLDGNYWCSIYLDASNSLVNAKIGKAHFGFEPWAVWKAALTGDGTDYPYIDVQSVFDVPSFEALGIGILGCADGKSALANTMLVDPTVSYDPTYTPSGKAFGPTIVAGSADLHIAQNGRDAFFSSMPSSAGSCIQADNISGDLGELGLTLANCNTIGMPFATGYTAITTSCSAAFTISANAGSFCISADSNIITYDVLGLRDFSVERAQRSGCAVAGVALLPPFESATVPVQLEGRCTVNVNASGDIPNGVGWVRANVDAPGSAIAATSQFDADGSVFAWRFSQGDNGSTCPCLITPRLSVGFA